MPLCIQPGRLNRALIMAIFPLLLLGCASQSTTAARPARTATASPVSTCDSSPASWGASYLNEDGRLHTVSLDGKTDRAGQVMPGLTMQGLAMYAWGVSPDGRHVAYGPSGTVDSANNTPCGIRLYGEGAVKLYWSPESHRLAVDSSGHGDLSMIDAATDTESGVLVSYDQHVDSLLGWVDDSHLAVRMLRPNAIALGSLDLTTHQVRLIATISQDHLGQDRERLSPDGKEVFVYNTPFRDDPYTPLAEVIDVASGQVRSLPTIARAVGFGFTTMVWKPGAEMGAASTGYAENGNLKAWVLDLSNDTMTHLLDGQHAEGWSPDGQVLVMGTGYAAAAQIGAGPFELNAVTFSPSGQPAIVPLTQSAMTFPFLGFVKTA